MSGARRGAGRHDPRVDVTHRITSSMLVFSGDAGDAAKGAATSVFAFNKQGRQQKQQLARDAASAGGPADRGVGDAHARPLPRTGPRLPSAVAAAVRQGGACLWALLPLPLALVALGDLDASRRVRWLVSV